METTHDLSGKVIAILATDGFEDSELSEPLEALLDAGAQVDIISDKEDVIAGKNGYEVDIDHTTDAVTAADYDGLLLPGGTANPDRLRLNDEAVQFVEDFFTADKPVAAICHAPWLLIEAGVTDGRTLTSWPSLRTDLINSGAVWVDQSVVVDENLITSRKPDDLPGFCEGTVELFATYPA